MFPSQLLPFLRDKPKYRKLPGTGDVHAALVFGAGQIECLTEFATINFPVGPPCLLNAAALLLEHVGGVEPALQVSAAEFALVVCFVAGALTRLLDLDLMVGKLRNFPSLCAGEFP